MKLNKIVFTFFDSGLRFDVVYTAIPRINGAYVFTIYNDGCDLPVHSIRCVFPVDEFPEAKHALSQINCYLIESKLHTKES